MLPLLEMRLSGKVEAVRDANGGDTVFGMSAVIRMPSAWYFQFGGGAICESLKCRYSGGKYGFYVLKYSFILFCIAFWAWLYGLDRFLKCRHCYFDN